MGEKNIWSCFNGLKMRYSFLFPETSLYFENYFNDIYERSCSRMDINVTPEFIIENRWLVNNSEQSHSFMEFQALMLMSGNRLLFHNGALFHGVALLWNDRAWILTAPSGTGKTTQLRHWKHILKKDVIIINGDKPLLECRKDGAVWVHSSPWRGKEKYGRPGLNALLGGIIFLKQGTENKIRLLEPSEVVLPLFTEFISFPETTEQIQCQARILEKMLDAVPVWELTNLGDEDSARLTIRTLEDYLETIAAGDERKP